MKKILILVFIIITSCTHAQENLVKHAQKEYDNLALYDAASGFEDTIARGADSALVADKLAESYYQGGDMEHALIWYNFLCRHASLSQDQMLRLIYINLYIGNYSNAIDLAKSYESKYHNSEWCRSLIREQKCFDELTVNSNFTIASENFNTNFVEFGTSYLGSSYLLLTSNRFSSGAVYCEDAQSGKPMLDLVVAQFNEKNELVHLKKVKGIKDHYNEGPACFDEKHGWIYFSSNNLNHKNKPTNGIVRIKIYRGKWDGRKIRGIEELNFNGNDFSCAHPSVNADGSLLYFSSDRPGGFGGTDLYCVPIHADGSPGTVQNLGNEVNTPGNEYFPFVHQKERILFFSSDGHLGFGGLDNFYCKLDHSLKAFGVHNLGKGINSSQDDFAFVVNEDQTKGFFSSNRYGGTGGDDIYRFIQRSPIRTFSEVKGVITDANTGLPLKNVMVLAKDKNGYILDSIYTFADGTYTLKLDESNKDFILQSSKIGYLESETDVSLISQDTIMPDLQVTPIPAYFVTGIIQDADSKSACEGVKVTVKDRKTGGIYTAISDSSGMFRTEVIPEFNYGDLAKLEVMLEKSGYVTITKTVEQNLGFSNEIFLTGEQTVQLNKIVVGKTNLAEVLVLNPIYFDYRKWAIRSDAALELDKIIRIMQDNPTMIIELASHTDTRGETKENQVLAQKRAEASAAYIVSKGIASNRIRAKGYGEGQPKVSDAAIKAEPKWEEQEHLHQLNRRTEFIIVKY